MSVFDDEVLTIEELASFFEAEAPNDLPVGAGRQAAPARRSGEEWRFGVP
jgi:hypothetical protein